MAKNEKSKFQLNKGGNHEFDISKGSKRRFDLTKDEDTPAVTDATETPQATAPVADPTTVEAPAREPMTPTTPDPEKRKSNIWLWLLLAIIVIGLLIWWLLPGKSSDAEPVIEEVVSEEVAVPAEDSQQMGADTTLPAEATTEAPTTDNGANSTPSEDGAGTSAAAAATAPAAPATTAPAASTANSGDNNNTVTAVSADVEAEALKVIRGDYGDGLERKNKLGNQYRPIQSRVNQLKREGAF